jgi:hypothetical protein
LALARMHPGAPGYAALADALRARYRRIYAETPLSIIRGSTTPDARPPIGEPVGVYADLAARIKAAYERPAQR